MGVVLLGGKESGDGSVAERTGVKGSQVNNLVANRVHPAKHTQNQTGLIGMKFPGISGAAGDAFLAAGGRDNGPPGMRAHYHPTYYGAFVLSPDGHNVEAVCHAPG